MNTRQVRVQDPVLTDFAHGYANQDRVGLNLFPTVPVKVRGGQVLQFGKEAFRKYHLRRAPGAKKQRIKFGYEGKPFALYQDSVEIPIPFEHMDDASVMPGIDLGKAATMMAMDIMSLQAEIEQAQTARDANNYNANNTDVLAGADQFSSPTAKPVEKIDECREAIRRQIGAYPNLAIFGPNAFTGTKNNPNVVSRFQFHTAEEITEDMLKLLFGVEKLVVGKGIYFDDADQPQDIWGNDIILAYVPRMSMAAAPSYAPGGQVNMYTPSYGYTYTIDNGPVVEEPYADRECDSWLYPAKYERASVITSLENDDKTTAGFLLRNVAA
jgi:hypothetical protein